MRLHKLQVWNRDETFWKCYPSKLTSLMAWAHGHHHPAGPGSFEHPWFRTILSSCRLTVDDRNACAAAHGFYGGARHPIVAHDHSRGAIFNFYNNILNSGIGSFVSRFFACESHHALSLCWFVEDLNFNAEHAVATAPFNGTVVSMTSLHPYFTIWFGTENLGHSLNPIRRIWLYPTCPITQVKDR